MKRIVVERTLEKPLRAEELAASQEARRLCFEMHRVRFIRSLISRDGLRVICEYEALDAESVRQANRKAGLPFDRVWTAEEYLPPRED